MRMAPRQKSDSPKAKRLKTTKTSKSNQVFSPESEKGKVAAVQLFASEAFQTWLACGKCANEYGALDIAINSFNAALKYDPYNRLALCGLASASRLKDIKENTSDWSKKVVQIITTCIQLYPDLGNDSNFWKELAECHLITGSAEQAHTALQRAIEINSMDPSLWLLSGQALVRAGIINGAVQSLTQALQSLPDQSTRENIDILRATHAELAAIHASEGDIELATNELKITLSFPPPPPERVDEHAALWCALATARERAGDIVGALSLCNTAHTAIGDYPRVLINHAYLLLLPGTQYFNPPHALALLEKVIDLESIPSKESPEANPEDFLPMFLKGYAYSMVESFKEAYDAYQLALRRCPSSPIPWLAVGGLYLQLGQLADALSAYSQAARLQSDDILNQSNPSSAAAAAAAAWVGLSCVYERCDDQANDAADACIRASGCFTAAGDILNASEAQKRAEILRQVARKEISSPPFQEAPTIPPVLLRDLVPLSQIERIELLKEPVIARLLSVPERTTVAPLAEPQDNAQHSPLLTQQLQVQQAQQQAQAQQAQQAQQQLQQQLQQQQQQLQQVQRQPTPQHIPVQRMASPYTPQFPHQVPHIAPQNGHFSLQQGPPSLTPAAYDSRRIPAQHMAPPAPYPNALQQQPQSFGLPYGAPNGFYYNSASPNGMIPTQQPIQQHQQQTQAGPPGFPYHPSYVSAEHMQQQQAAPHHYPIQSEWR